MGEVGSKSRQAKHMIHEMQKKLDETKAAFEQERSPVADSMSLVIPMMEEQIEIMKVLVRIIEEVNG